MSTLTCGMGFYNPRVEVDKTLHKLPHWQQGRVPVFVTFRLSDSLPQDVLAPLLEIRDHFLATNPKPWSAAVEDEFHRNFSVKLESRLDAGHGCCSLREERTSEILAERFHHLDTHSYALHCYAIMPNHVHVLFSPFEGRDLPKIIKGWKGVSSRMIHQAQLSALNPFWQPDYFDRLIRSPAHLLKVADYIGANPAKAGLKSGYRVWQNQEGLQGLRPQNGEVP